MLVTDGKTIQGSKGDVAQLVEDLKNYFKNTSSYYSPSYTDEGKTEIECSQEIILATRASGYELAYSPDSNIVTNELEKVTGAMVFTDIEKDKMAMVEHGCLTEMDYCDTQAKDWKEKSKSHKESAEDMRGKINIGYQFVDFTGVRVCYDETKGIKVFLDRNGNIIKTGELSESDYKHIRQGGEFKQLHIA